MATYTKHTLEKQLEKEILAGTSNIMGSDVVRDGDFEYTMREILDTIHDMGYPEEKFLELPAHKKRRVSKESKRILRQRARDKVREAQKKAVPGRRLKVDDLIIMNGQVATAGDLNDAMESIIRREIEKQTENLQPLLEAFAIVGLQGKLAWKPPDYSDNCVVYSGLGPEIEDPIIIPSGVDDKMVLAPSFFKRIKQDGRGKASNDDSHWAKFEAACRRIEETLLRGGLVLQKPQGSSLHHLAEYSRVHGEGRFYKAIQPGGPMSHVQDFVITHNWAAAFKDAENFSEGEFRLPYDQCAFQFRISDLRVVAMYEQDGSNSQSCSGIVIGCDEVWVFAPFAYDVVSGNLDVREMDSDNRADMERVTKKAWEELFTMIHLQVRACAIMLEAKVAVVDTVRVSERLNFKRERLGRAKLRDHHVVVLSKERRRASRVPDEYGHSDRSPPRCHLRRGHWRHYTGHRTWIEWQLVGDPDLGFVEKHYLQ